MNNKLNIDDFYRVISVKGNVVHVEINGFWSDTVIDEIGPQFLKIYEDAVKRVGGKRYITLADWSSCPVLGEKALEYLTKAMLIVKRYHGYKVVEVTPSALTRMGIKKAAKKTGKDDFRVVVTTLAEAHLAVIKLNAQLANEL